MVTTAPGNAVNALVSEELPSPRGQWLEWTEDPVQSVVEAVLFQIGRKAFNSPTSQSKSKA